MNNFIKQLLDWIYRKKCYICGKETSTGSACNSCVAKVELNPLAPLDNVHLLEVYSASLYTCSMRELIRGLKYHNKKDLAKPIAQIMYEYWKSLKISKKKFEIVPMPLHPKREKERGYNQVLLIAEEFSKLTGYPINTKIAKRVRYTEPQYKLSKAERKKNLKDAFEVNAKAYTGKNLLILDDITTTGATVEELKKTFEYEDIPVNYALVSANPMATSPFG